MANDREYIEQMKQVGEDRVKNIENNNVENIGLLAAQNQLKQDMLTSEIEKKTAEFNKEYQKWRKENLPLLERSFGPLYFSFSL